MSDEKPGNAAKGGAKRGTVRQCGMHGLVLCQLLTTMSLFDRLIFINGPLINTGFKWVDLMRFSA